MYAVTVPGGVAELLLLAKVACDAYKKGGGLAAIAAVKAAEPNITFSRKDPMLILDAPTFLENTNTTIAKGILMKKAIIGGIAALAIGLTGCSGTGGAPKPTLSPKYTAAAPTTTTPPWLHPVVTAPTKFFVGDIVYHGSLRFTVDSVRREAWVYDQFGGSYGASGKEFVIVKLSVWNQGTQPVFFYYTQTLDLHGQQISGDNAATYALNTAINPLIQPGLGIPIQMAFFVPMGEQPEAIMLSDALYTISNPSAAATRVELIR